ncbi:MAG: helix-hairpin-helix domain-containing protein [Betaproteobacteria bacterium]|nr:helix-hairpin-helix domain-containing protein [Betaproteobacteria bacterium]MDE2212551.1 helix-hairpin-helix domain-containing protein [Betaproteobacteria bacterium]
MPNLSAPFRRFLFALLALWLVAAPAWALVDLNTASEQQLRTVKGIGPVKARAILAYRSKYGSFHSLSDLRKIKGFGAKTVARLAPGLSISGRPASAPAATPSGPPTAASVGPRGRH